MGTYLRDELERKGLGYYNDQIEGTLAAREGKKESLRCYECFYSMFGKCPVDGHRNNAACLTMQKSYFDMDRKELEEVTEAAYKKALQDAAQLYHIRMNYIKNLAEAKGEKQDEETEPEPIH